MSSTRPRENGHHRSCPCNDCYLLFDQEQRDRRSSLAARSDVLSNLRAEEIKQLHDAGILREAEPAFRDEYLVEWVPDDPDPLRLAGHRVVQPKHDDYVDALDAAYRAVGVSEIKPRTFKATNFGLSDEKVEELQNEIDATIQKIQEAHKNTRLRPAGIDSPIALQMKLEKENFDTCPSTNYKSSPPLPTW